MSSVCVYGIVLVDPFPHSIHNTNVIVCSCNGIRSVYAAFQTPSQTCSLCSMRLLLLLIFAAVAAAAVVRSFRSTWSVRSIFMCMYRWMHDWNYQMAMVLVHNEQTNERREKKLDINYGIYFVSLVLSSFFHFNDHILCLETICA